MIFFAQFLGYEVALWLLWEGGNLFVRFLLDAGNVQKAPGLVSGAGEEPPKIRAGKYIGPLERIIIVAGLLVGSWQIIAAVVALKTLARYKELDVQITAEYFLVGSF